jgi:hypothetical protein
VLRRPVVRRVAAVAVAALLAGAAATAGSTSAGASAPAPAVGVVNPPALWMQLNETPTEAQLQFAAKHYRVAVFNAWQLPALKRLKELNPAITVLVYKCLSSTRSYRGAHAGGVDAPLLPTGVGYGEAAPEWFATDTAGQRIEWGPYPGHWQMAMWDPAYQDRWVQNVTREVVANGWDGVLADNAFTTLKYYTSAQLSGGRTDADLRSAVEALVAKAGTSLRGNGKLLVPNISDARLHAGRWDRLSAYGGGFEEQFLHWGSDPATGYVGDWRSGGWSVQAAQITSAGLPLARTSAGPNDVRPYRYGLASFWIAGGGKGAFTAVLPDQYGGTPLRTEQTWDLGAPLSGPVRVGTAWTRTFAGGFVAANPSETTPAVVTVPPGMVDADGAAGGTLTLPPLTGVLYRVDPAAVPAPATAEEPATAPAQAPAAAPLIPPVDPSAPVTGTVVGLAGQTCVRGADGGARCASIAG